MSETEARANAEVEEKKVTAGAEVADEAEDPELEAMKKRVKEMMDEAEKLKALQSKVESSLSSNSSDKAANAVVDKEARDSRSVYVGNVDYSTVPDELQKHFGSCGIVNNVTILTDSYTGQPKGYAYVEFKDVESVDNAVVLNESIFKGRPLKVSVKRTNVPGLKSRGRGRGRGRGGYGYAPYYRPRPRFRNKRGNFGQQ